MPIDSVSKSATFEFHITDAGWFRHSQSMHPCFGFQSANLFLHFVNALMEVLACDGSARGRI
jgi:hypothetical protein